MNGAYRKIRETLQSNPEAKFGFVIYRCTYNNDADWHRFMELLNEQTKTSLEENKIGDLYSRIDWNVQQDPSLDEADFEEVRRRFRQWIQSGSEPNYALPRHHACVMVNKESLDSIIKSEEPFDFDMFGVMWVYLISKRDEYPEDDQEAEGEGNDAAIEEKEDDKVSYTSVGISYLIPRVYSLLNGPGWQNFADPDGGVAIP